MMDNSYNTPISVQLTQTLLDRIRDGYYRPDVHFPSEADLCKEFGVSRATVRTALAALVAKNLLVKKFGIGSFLVPGAQDMLNDQPSVKIKVALIMAGLMADGGWNTLAYNGLEQLKNQGYQTAFSENIQPAQIDLLLHQYADAGFDLVIGHGWQFGEAFIDLASHYPQQKFFVMADWLYGSIPSNLQFFQPPTRYSGYMAGALASLVSKSHVIGFVGGGDNPIQRNLSKAFSQAAAETVSGTIALSDITGDYNDVSRGRTAAQLLIRRGVDVIWHSADLTGLGVISGAVEGGAYVIGNYSDQTSMAYKSFLSSIYWDLGYVVVNRSQAVYQNTFQGGCNWEPNFYEIFRFVAGGSNTPYVNINVPPEIQKKMEIILTKLRNGEIRVTAEAD